MAFVDMCFRYTVVKKFQLVGGFVPGTNDSVINKQQQNYRTVIKDNKDLLALNHGTVCECGDMSTRRLLQRLSTQKKTKRVCLVHRE